jgi:hypothetical protein
VRPLDVRTLMPHHDFSGCVCATRHLAQPRSIPTFEAKAPWTLGMVCPMRGLLFFCAILIAASAPAGAVEPAVLAGTWVGTHDGQPVVWQVVDADRIRVDGRPADYEIHGDTLVVRFDPPTGTTEPGEREVAVYHFLASTPSTGQARLFLSGFDLGKQGALLLREPEEESGSGNTEDAAPQLPSRTSRSSMTRTAAIPSAGDHSQH